jgi:hypothetical protein
VQHALTLLALSAVIALCTVPRSARAEPREPGVATAPQGTRVLLVASPGMEELELRFAAELDSLRLETVRVPDRVDAPTVSELEQLALLHSARVAVRVSKSGRAIDLWLVDPSSQELVYRRIRAEGDPAVQVLRSLEILRGALTDLRAVEAAAPEPLPALVPAPPAPEALRAPPAPSTPSTWLGASGALLAPHLGRSLAVGGLVALRRRLAPHLALHAELLAPFSGFAVRGEGGRARVWLGGASGAAVVQPWGDGRLAPAAGLGVGLLALQTRGEAEAGYEGESDLNVAVFPHARAELGFGVTRWLRLRAALVAGFATPRPVLLFGDERAESWLNPLLASSLGVEVALP